MESEAEQTIAPPVTLEQSTTDWETYAYELTRFDTILSGSYDGESKMTHTFDTWILENEYLQVTLVPEFGGRILSIVYKPTGHEQLYQNPLGVPYQIDTNVFYHNWLMVYGGIFPTFPEPEHGKAWFYPWDFQIVDETDEAITVSMSYTDDEDRPLAPARYDTGTTGLTVTFLVTVEAGRAAVDTEVVITNSSDETVRYEYWTNATFAPGSDPANPRITAGAEIIAPIDLIEIPPLWSEIRAVEEPTELADVYEFDELRRFDNWVDLGIAYAFPDMRNTNFWGVINHDETEGIFRVADNDVTPGLKLWTWGYEQTLDLDPRADPDEARPYIEMWAGVTRKFFERAEIAATSELRFVETYAPSVGLNSVTHATPHLLVDIRVEDESILVEIFALEPGRPMTAYLTYEGTELAAKSLISEADAAASWVVDLDETVPIADQMIIVRDEAGETLLEARIPDSSS